jgi:hypothetical protein
MSVLAYSIAGDPRFTSRCDLLMISSISLESPLSPVRAGGGFIRKVRLIGERGGTRVVVLEIVKPLPDSLLLHAPGPLIPVMSEAARRTMCFPSAW